MSASTTKTPEMFHETFGEHSLSQTVVVEWHPHFKAGEVSVEDEECSGRPSTSKITENVEENQELIHEFVPANTMVNLAFTVMYQDT
jgi:hypothetical protein